MARFVVDTSVWIDFFRGVLKSQIFGILREAIELRVAVLTDIIRHEILVGARSENQYRELQRLLSPLECLRVGGEDLEGFDRFAWHLHRQGFKGKYTDASIAYLCHRHRIPLLTFDGYFQSLARRGVIFLVS